MVDNSKPVRMPDAGLPSRLDRLRWAFWDRVDGQIPYGVRRWIADCIWLHPTRLTKRVWHVLSWAPFLWGDVDWDYSALFAVMEEKIRRMRALTLSSGLHGDAEQTAASMAVAIDCLSRLRRDCFASDLWDAHYEAFPRDFEFEELPPGQDGTRLSRLRPMSEEAADDFRKIMVEEERQWQETMALLCATLTKDIRIYWD